MNTTKLNNVKNKYSVLTYVFGNYDFVREIINKLNDVEYLLITDNKTLKSSTWKVIYDEEFANMQIFEKYYYIKYHLFKYCTTDICVYIDGSIQIKYSLDKLVNDFKTSNCDIGLLAHPYIPVFIPELQLWILQRKYSVERANNFLKFISKTHYDLNYKSYFLTTCSIKKNTKLNTNINDLTYQLIKNSSTNEDYERNDQFWLAYVLNTWYNDINVFFMHPQITESYAMQRYEHATWNKASIAGMYDINIPYKAWCFNQLKETYYLK